MKINRMIASNVIEKRSCRYLCIYILIMDSILFRRIILINLSSLFFLFSRELFMEIVSSSMMLLY